MPLPSPDRVAELLGRTPENPELDPTMAQAGVAMVIDWARRTAGEPGQEFAAPPRVLLMQRATHPRDPWSGQVSLPGGRAEECDGDLLCTAIRETREELGIDLTRSARHLGSLPARRARARGGLVNLWITPHVFEVLNPLTPVPGPEATEAFWLSLGPARRGELDHGYPYRASGEEHILPSWRLDQRIIWGMTYRMLLELFEHASET